MPKRKAQQQHDSCKLQQRGPEPSGPAGRKALLTFAPFCAARQAVLLRRKGGLPQEQWTTDPILARAKFCNIDRRDDAVTAELLAEVAAHVGWELKEKVLLALALRFSGSRRGEAAALAVLIESGRKPDERVRSKSPLQLAFAADEVRCGSGTYQLSLNRRQVATVIESTAAAVVERVGAHGPFEDVLEASNFVATCMTVGKRPQFSANEAAKDFAYVDGLMLPASHHRCHLGPGAKKGLQLVRASEGDALGIGKGSTDDAAVAVLRGQLRAIPSLAWVQTIDVEQALCEFAKYEAYRTGGISATKTFTPFASV